MRLPKPKTRYELYKKVLMMWYRSEKESIRIFGGDARKLQYRELKEKYDKYLQMWEDIRI